MGRGGRAQVGSVSRVAAVMGGRGWSWNLLLLTGHFSSDLAMGEAGRDFVADADLGCILQELASGIEDQSVASVEDGEWRKGFEGSLQALGADAVLQENVASDRDQGGRAAFELLAHSRENESQIIVAHSGGDCFPAAVHLLEELALGDFQAVSEVVEFLLALVDDLHHAGEGAVLRELGEGLAVHQQAIAHGTSQAVVQGRGILFDLLTGSDDKFCCRGRSRRPQVCDKINDGEIGFVADRGDHRNFGGCDGAGKSFVVEGSEIFGGTSAAGDDDDVDVVVLIEVTHSGSDFMRSSVALHLGWKNQHVHGMMAALEDVENIAKGRGLCGGHDTNPRWKLRNRLLAFGGEEAFGFQLGFELLEGELKRSGAFGFDVFGGDLQFAAIFVDGDASADDNLETVCGTEAQKAGRRAEHDDLNLGVSVFEGEVEVSGVGGAEVGDFAFDPGVGIFAFDVRADGGDEVADFPDAALWRAEGEA